MNNNDHIIKDPSSYPDKIAQQIFDKVFRTTTEKPGFAYLDLGKKSDSYQLRKLMIDLKHELCRLVKQTFDKKLAYQWLTRFDQQENTKLHQDNAGNQSFLMLGYEPTAIESDLYIADYVQFSHDHQINSIDFFEKYNPLFIDQNKELQPYITKVQELKKDHYQIILINNSNSAGNCETFGVLHQAKMTHKDHTKSRIVNSMMLNMINIDEKQLSNIDEQEFRTTSEVNR